MNKIKVYSYLRFSDPKQSVGHSAERQIEYAKRWAEENGAALDTELTLRDEGLSAYHQKHVKSGALGTFLRAIDEGRISPGSILIVEGLDRLSRAEPIQAQAQLSQIINAGITVVTASDNKVYNRERVKAQPMDLVYSLLVMIRAHEESDTKSKRVSAAVRRQCEAWEAGTYRGVIRNGKDPGWLRWDGEKFVEIPERAEPLRRMLRLWLEGWGYAASWRRLRDEGINTDLLPKTQATFYKMVSKSYIAGIKTIAAGGKTFELQGYYPPLVDLDLYNRVRGSRNVRRWKRGETSTPGVVLGVGRTFCGYCGSVMVAQNLWAGRPLKIDGTPQDGHRRARCMHSTDSCISCSCSVAPLEKALLSYCSDQLRLDALLAPVSDLQQQANAALAATRARTADIEKKLTKITAALLADDGPTPISFLRAARELESELEHAKEEEKAAETEATKAAAHKSPANARAWAELVDGVLKLDIDSRMRARQMVIDTFERIVIYPIGITPGDSRTSPIDMVLISRGGSPRMLRINRRSGELIDLEDVSDSD